MPEPKKHVRDAAELWNFRPMQPGESDAQYRAALADHVHATIAGASGTTPDAVKASFDRMVKEVKRNVRNERRRAKKA